MTAAAVCCANVHRYTSTVHAPVHKLEEPRIQHRIFRTQRMLPCIDVNRSTSVRCVVDAALSTRQHAAHFLRILGASFLGHLISFTSLLY